MTVDQMRVELEKKYSKAFVTSKTDGQIVAIYRRLQSQNKL